MQVYEFALCTASDGARDQNEQLGYLALPNNNEAIEFAKQIAEDLAQADGKFAGSVVKISSAKRHVSSIPVESSERKSRVA